MKELTLYDIMGSNHYVIANIVDSQVNIQVLDEYAAEVFNETSHPFAWDSLVSFARMVLNQDEKIQKELFDE